MSVVIAVKENGKVYMGADTQSTRGSQKVSGTNLSNFKIVKVRNIENCIIGLVGNVRTTNILRMANDLIPDDYSGEIDFEFINNRILPYIFENSEKHGVLLTDKDDDSKYVNMSCLIAYRDKLFRITSGTTVLECSDYFAIGSGDDVAFGSLMATEGLSAEERILKALSISAKYNIYVGAPFIISNTETCEIKLIED